MRELFDTTLNHDDRAMSREQLETAVKTADVLVPTVTDKVDADLLACAGDQLRLIASFGWALTIWIWRGQSARNHRYQHPRRADRRHRRCHNGAYSGGAAADR